MIFKYSLDKSPKKYICPACGKKRFVRYIDNSTGKHVNETSGRCDREIDCGYHEKPDKLAHIINTTQSVPEKPTYYIPPEIFLKTLNRYHENNLIIFLNRIFDSPSVKQQTEYYHIGTSKKWPGATIYWQINHEGVFGQGKIMLHDPVSGKRVKHPYPHVSSVHAQMKKQDQKPEMCYFGEHLLNVFPNRPVALVESEKTAVIMSIFDKKYLWLATGSLSNLNTKRLLPLKNRKIVLYPDLGAFETWNKKACEIRELAYDISVSDLLERNATKTDKKEGFDIADFFTKPILTAMSGSEALQLMKKKNSALQKFIECFKLVEFKRRKQ